MGLQCYIFGFKYTTDYFMKNPENIEFLIFDLGNVIIDIDYDFSINELKKLLPEHKHRLTDKFFTSNFHKEFEKGLISSDQFRNEVRNLYGENWHDTQIDHIWNSLLREIPQERIDLIKSLRKTYHMAVLSNTNQIHVEKFDEILQQNTSEKSLFDLFDKVFLSHEMGLAKPDVAIYEAVLNDISISPHKVLFFDDLPANLEGAKKTGIQTFHISHKKALLEFFNYK
jgi:glucose-1-phosphatase